MSKIRNYALIKRKTMKSPFTGGEVVLLEENMDIIFREEKFQYVALYYLCEDTKERFTTTEIDEINISKVYRQYCIKHGITSFK